MAHGTRQHMSLQALSMAARRGAPRHRVEHGAACLDREMAHAVCSMYFCDGFGCYAVVLDLACAGSAGTWEQPAPAGCSCSNMHPLGCAAGAGQCRMLSNVPGGGACVPYHLQAPYTRALTRSNSTRADWCGPAFEDCCTGEDWSALRSHGPLTDQPSPSLLFFLLSLAPFPPAGMPVHMPLPGLLPLPLHASLPPVVTVRPRVALPLFKRGASS